MGALLSLFWSKHLDLVLVGLENRWSPSRFNALQRQDHHTQCPHPRHASGDLPHGMNVRLATKGGIKMKCWDLGGQAAYRSEWSRYTKGCQAVLFVVDSHAFHKLPIARKELHKLLDDKSTKGIPLLIVSNKLDLDPHISEAELIRELNLDYIVDNPWVVIPCSALKNINIDKVLDWLVKQSK